MTVSSASRAISAVAELFVPLSFLELEARVTHMDGRTYRLAIMLNATFFKGVVLLQMLVITATQI